MEENKIKNAEVIDLRIVIKTIWNNRRLFYKVLPITFVVSCIYILGFPRYYRTEVRLAPELGNSMANGTLGSIASSFGIDLGSMETSDAITPLLYPDLIEDNGFVVSLFDIKVKSQDGEINTTYHDYLKKYQKKSLWSYPFNQIAKLLKSKDEGGSSEFDPYYLSRDENAIANIVRDNVKISVDKVTAVISIRVDAQDALICRTLADSVKDHLQAFITDYRTRKARIDYEYYKKLAQDAKHEYEKTRQIYSGMSDANTRIALRSVELKLEDMENDMQLKYNSYTTLAAQLEAAKAKVQERTPAFTVIKGADVPVKPIGPKRMIFVLLMLVLASIGTSLYVLRKSHQ
jgi:capsule polysaccharide export protein KpsE/RkpR